VGYLVDTAVHLDQLDQHGVALADAAERAGLGVAVPSCPRWDVRDLLAHIGMVHRWAATHVHEGKAAFADGASPQFPAPTDGVVAWYREGHAALVATLHTAPDDLDAMTFLADPGPPRSFWARRQAHETAIHHADVAGAAGSKPDFARDFALDGIAELLEGFYGRRSGALRADPPVRIRIAPGDADLSWLIELSPDDRTITRDGTGEADATLRGTAAALYCVLWNRPGAFDLDGDERALEVWRETARVRWR
jgi:uncharacterized protein (TIGR03083 family)